MRQKVVSLVGGRGGGGVEPGCHEHLCLWVGTEPGMQNSALFAPVVLNPLVF